MSLRLAVVGAGPSAFYCAHRVLSRLPSASVHLYDRLWAPHGLVRYGVAPDHPEVKNCTHKFDETAQDSRFKFFGNVSLSQHLPLSNSLSIPLPSLFPYYTHLILAHGAGESVVLNSLDPIHTRSALSFVHWYTGHPSGPPPPPLSATTHMTLIGHGNVSLDVARLLLSDPDKLSLLDIPVKVIDQLKSSSIRHIDIVSRRGPAQVAFTAKELRELLNLPTASMDPIPTSLFPELSSPALSRQQSRILSLLSKGSKNPPRSTPRTFSIRFLRSPQSSSSTNRTITYDLNTLDEQDRARRTGESETQRTDLIVTSLGYRSDHFTPSPSVFPSLSTQGTEGEAVDGWYDSTLGRVRNVSGRVYDVSGALVKNVYTSGWAANGARGVLASTMYDAYSVADMLTADHLSGDAGVGGDAAVDNPVAPAKSVMASAAQVQALLDSKKDGMPDFLRNASIRQEKRIIDYKQWKMIDEEETRRGQRLGKERERMRWDEVNEFLAQKFGVQ